MYLYWEGVRERYIQHVKPILKNKRKSVSYLTTKLTHLLQQHALQKMAEDATNNLNDRYLLNNNITVLASLQGLRKAIENHESLIVLLHKTDHHTCMAVTHMDDMFVCHALEFDDHRGYHMSNLWCAPINIGSPILKPYTTKSDVLNDCSDFALLVPMKHNIEKTDQRSSADYAVLTKNWYTITQHGTYSLPSLSKELFNFIIT